jgi:hypothetical protein
MAVLNRSLQFEKVWGQIMRRNYVSKIKVEEIFGIIKSIQEEPPLHPVTKKAVKLTSAHTKNAIARKDKKLDYRLIARAFKILENENRIERADRGQYWLPGYREKNMEYWKRKFELEELMQRKIEPLIEKQIFALQEKLFYAEQAELEMSDEIEKKRILDEIDRDPEKYKWPMDKTR